MSPKPRRAAPEIAPVQKRSRESHERILATAERLLTKSGASQLTLAAVSKASGVSIGGIYRRFEDREALIRAIQERVNEKMAQDYLTLERDLAAQPETLEARVTYLVASLTTHLRNHMSVIKAIVEASWSDPIVAARGREMFRIHEKKFVSALLEFRSAITHENPEHAAKFCFGSIYELVASYFGVGGRSADEHGRWSTLVGDLQRVCTAYLTMPGKRSSASRARRPTRSSRRS